MIKRQQPVQDRAKEAAKKSIIGLKARRAAAVSAAAAQQSSRRPLGAALRCRLPKAVCGTHRGPLQRHVCLLGPRHTCRLEGTGSRGLFACSERGDGEPLRCTYTARATGRGAAEGDGPRRSRVKNRKRILTNS